MRLNHVVIRPFAFVPLPDIKPENLLISSEDVLKLCDFGESLVFPILFFTGAIMSRKIYMCGAVNPVQYLCI